MAIEPLGARVFSEIELETLNFPETAKIAIREGGLLVLCTRRYADGLPTGGAGLMMWTAVAKLEVDVVETCSVDPGPRQYHAAASPGP